MSRKKSRMQSVREAKDRRAKKIAIGGGVLLVALLAFEIPHYLGGSKSAAPAPATTATAPTGSTTPGATTPASATPGVPAVATAPTPPAKVTNSDLPPSNSKEQLSSFSTFASKDPFDQQVTADSGVTGSTGSSSTTAPPSGATASSTTSQPVVTAARTLAHSGAVKISVNGRPESVRVGASFPSANPVFRLVSISSGGVRIGIANGSYSSGAQTVLLGLNRSVTLVDTANGAHYKLRLLGS
jgi:hypothetical protein